MNAITQNKFVDSEVMNGIHRYLAIHKQEVKVPAVNLEAVSVNAEKAANINSVLGYNAMSKVETYRPNNYREEFVIANGNDEQKKAAYDFMSEKEAIANKAARETIDEIESATAAAELKREELFFTGSKNGNASFELMLEEALYIKLRLNDKKDEAAKVFAACIETATNSACKIDPEILDLKADRVSAENLMKNIHWFWCTKVWYSSTKSCNRSILKLAGENPLNFKRWLDGFKGGYTHEANGLVWHDRQPEKEAIEISRARVMGIASIITGKMVEEGIDADGFSILKKGVRNVDIDKALVGWFGDINSEFADIMASRAASINNMLDYHAACGMSVRDALKDIKLIRESRAADRKMELDFYGNVSGITTAKFELDRAFEQCEETVYGVSDIDVDTGVSEEQWVRWFSENSKTINQIIWDFVAIIRCKDTIRSIEINLGLKKGSLERWASIKAPAIYDMWYAQMIVATELGYSHVLGDEQGLIKAILDTAKIANRRAGASGSAWLNMFAAASKYIHEIDIVQAFNDDEDLFGFVESRLIKTNIRPTKGMVAALIAHKVPGIWKHAAEGTNIVYDGMFCNNAYAKVGDGFVTENVSGSEVFGCALYETYRQMLADTVIDGNSLIKWYGKLIRKSAPEYEAEICLEVVKTWMDGIKAGQKPWESYPMAGIIKGNPIFDEAAIKAFGNKDTAFTRDYIDTIDQRLIATASAYDLIKDLNNYNNSIAGKTRPATESETNAVKAAVKNTDGVYEWFLNILMWEPKDSTEDAVTKINEMKKEFNID